MATTAWKACGTCANDATIGTTGWYSNASLLTALAGSEVSTDNNVNAEAALGSLTTSNYLKCTNFGFSSSDVPVGSTINGIEWRFSRYRGSIPTDASTNCKLVKGGSIVGSTITVAADWPTSETSTSMGGATELGGQSWTQSDIVSSGLGVVISVTSNSTRIFPSGATNFIDIVEMRIHYTAPATGVATAFAQVVLKGTVNAYAKRTIGSAFAKVVIGATVVGTRLTNIYQKYAFGANLNVSQMTNDAPNLRDNSVGDNTTYYTNPQTSANSSISAYFDLGSAKQVGRVRFRYAFKDSDSWTFYGSNDGTSWTNAYTGLGMRGFGSCAIAWATEVNTTQVTSTSYRFWRLVITDSLGMCPTQEARLGDYRIYDTSGNEYVAMTPPSVTIREGTALAQVVVQAKIVTGKIKRTNPNARVVIAATVQPTRLRRGVATARVVVLASVVPIRTKIRQTFAQLVVQRSVTVFKTKTQTGFAQLVVQASSTTASIRGRYANANLVVAAQANVTRLRSGFGFGQLVLQAAIVGRKDASQVAYAQLVVLASVTPGTIRSRSSLAQVVVLASTREVRIKIAQVYYAPEDSIPTLPFIQVRGIGKAVAISEGTAFGVVQLVSYSDHVKIKIRSVYFTTEEGAKRAIPTLRILATAVSASISYATAFGQLVVRTDVQPTRVKPASAFAQLTLAANVIASEADLASTFAQLVITATSREVRIKTAVVGIDQVEKYDYPQLQVFAKAIGSKVKNATSFSTLIVLGQAIPARIKTTSLSATIIIDGTAVSNKLRTAIGYGVLQLTGQATGIRLKNQTVVATLVVTARATGVRIKNAMVAGANLVIQGASRPTRIITRTTTATLVITATVVGTKTGGRRRIFLIT